MTSIQNRNTIFRGNDIVTKTFKYPHHKPKLPHEDLASYTYTLQYKDYNGEVRYAPNHFFTFVIDTLKIHQYCPIVFDMGSRDGEFTKMNINEDGQSFKTYLYSMSTHHLSYPPIIANYNIDLTNIKQLAQFLDSWISQLHNAYQIPLMPVNVFTNKYGQKYTKRIYEHIIRNNPSIVYDIASKSSRDCFITTDDCDVELNNRTKVDLPFHPYPLTSIIGFINKYEDDKEKMYDDSINDTDYELFYVRLPIMINSTSINRRYVNPLYYTNMFNGSQITGFKLHPCNGKYYYTDPQFLLFSATVMILFRLNRLHEIIGGLKHDDKCVKVIENTIQVNIDWFDLLSENEKIVHMQACTHACDLENINHENSAHYIRQNVTTTMKTFLNCRIADDLAKMMELDVDIKILTDVQNDEKNRLSFIITPQTTDELSLAAFKEQMSNILSDSITILAYPSIGKI